MARKLKIGTFLSSLGDHLAAWRLPSSPSQEGDRFEGYLQAARLAEQALLDFVFLGDVAPQSTEPLETLSRQTGYDRLDPLALLAALAPATSRIGLIATASTTHSEPYPLARQLASIDRISKGRVGWNLVTTMTETDALNHSRERHPSHADRYARAEEFVDVVRGLWNSWEDDAFLRSKESGIYFDPAKLHLVDHKGPHFAVRGPLDVPRSVQGQPVIVQAGSSEPGRRLAARTAEIVFTSQRELSAARAFYADIKARAAAFGRGPEEINILVGLMPIVGGSAGEAAGIFAELQRQTHISIALARLSALFGGVDLRGYDLDKPVPELPEGNGLSSRRQMLIDLAKRDNFTLGQLALLVSGPRGHLMAIGTAAQVADLIEEWFVTEAADGFVLSPATIPDGLARFADGVIPELQRRGLFRTAYEGTTLRESLGLSRPPHPAASGAAPQAALSRRLA